MFPKAPQHRSEAWRRAVAALPCAVYMREGIAGFALSGWPRNVEFSGVPAGHSSNHPAGGTSAGTQG